MKIGLVIYGSLDTLSGGYLYDRRLVEYLRSCGDTVEILSLPWRNYAAHLTDNLHFRLPPALDILIEDELNHPSLLMANRGQHPYPIISLVHHLRCSELRPKWQNSFYRLIERLYLNSVDGFVFNSQTTQIAVHDLLDDNKPGIIAHPPTDRFGAPISEEKIVARSQTSPLRILFLGNVIYRKGLHTLLEAVRNLTCSVAVDVVGGLRAEPAYVKQIQEYIVANALSSFLFLHGPLDSGPLATKLREAHVLVVPSSYEGFGIVYLEAMGFGLPVIGTTAGAASEIIEPGRTGFLISPGDSASLSGHLKTLAEDRALLARLSLDARQRYLMQPVWVEMAGRIREFLHSMATQH